MKISIDGLLKIQSITKREYETNSSSDSEYVRIYDDEVEIMVEKLLDYIDELERELEHKQEEIDDIIEDRDVNFKRIPLSEQVNISDKDFI